MTRLGLVLLATLLGACPGNASPGSGDGPLVKRDGQPPPDATSADGTTSDTAPGDGPAPVVDTVPSGPAYLHANLWSVWWNDRTRCGAERTFLEICQERAEPDCTLYQQAVTACNPTQIIYGQVGPEKQNETLCQRGKFPGVGGCIAANYDFLALRFWWYGAEWQGNWPVTTLKIFPAGKDWKGGGELIALSSHPGLTQAAMAGIQNHGLGWGCTIQGATSGDAAYRTPFGAFAWVEVPTNTPVTIAAMAGSNFAGQAFAGCSRGTAKQSPWITDAPGAQLGCVYIKDNVTFAPGRHYVWRYGQLTELPIGSGPPQEIRDVFANTVGKDVQTRTPCKL